MSRLSNNADDGRGTWVKIIFFALHVESVRKNFFFVINWLKVGHNSDSGWAALLKPGQFCTIMAWIHAPDVLPRAMERTRGRRDTNPFHETVETRISMKQRRIYSVNDLQIYQI